MSEYADLGAKNFKPKNQTVTKTVKSGISNSSDNSSSSSNGKYVAGTGYVSNTGEIYPTSNPNFTPQNTTNMDSGSGSYSINPQNIVKSEVAGVNQVAVRNRGNFIIENQPTNTAPTIEQTKSLKSNEILLNGVPLSQQTPNLYQGTQNLNTNTNNNQNQNTNQDYLKNFKIQEQYTPRNNNQNTQSTILNATPKTSEEDKKLLNNLKNTTLYAPKEGEREPINPDSISLSQESIKAFKQGGVVGVAGGTVLATMSIAKGAGQATLGGFEFFSPYSIQQNKLQVPVFTPLLEGIKSAKDIPEYIYNEPFEAIGTVAGSFLGAKGTSNVYENSPFLQRNTPKVAVRTITIPQEQGTPINIKILAIEQNGRAFIIASLKESDVNSLKVFNGAPDISSELKNLEITGNQGEGIRISNPSETKIIQKGLENLNPENLVSESRAKEFIPTVQNIIRKTSGTQSKFITGFNEQGTEFLDSNAVNIVLDTVKNEQSFVSGSFSRSAQLSKNYEYGGEQYVLNKVPKDIDIHIEGSPEKIQLVAENTLNKLKSAGYDVRLKGEGGIVKNAIEIKDKLSGKYNKAVEFLGEGAIPDESVPPDMVVGFSKSGSKIDIGGVQSTSLNEELRGTIQGSARVRRLEDGKIDIYPREGRVKDIGSVSISSRTLQQSKTFDLFGLQKDIEKFESLYPDELVKSQVELVGSNSEKVILADFRQSSVSKTGSLNLNAVQSEFQTLSDLNKKYNDAKRSLSSSSPNVQEPKVVSIVSISASNEQPSLFNSPNKNYASENISSQSSSNSNSNINSPIKFSPVKSISSSNKVSENSFPISPSNVPPPSNNPPSSTITRINPSNISPPSNNPPSSTITRISPTDKSPPTKISSLPKIQKQKSSGSGMFSVLVRKQGKFVKIGSGYSDLATAINRGKQEVKNTARASFKIVSDFGGSVKLNLGSDRTLTNSKNPREPNLVVQKREFRISTVGEKREIRPKGFSQIKRKGMFR